MQSLSLLTRTAAVAGHMSETASLVYSPYSSTARGQALLMSSLDGHVTLFKIADAVVSTFTLVLFTVLHALVYIDVVELSHAGD